MKKIIALLAVVLVCSFNTTNAQGGGGGGQTPEQRAAAQKERFKGMGLNDVQVDSVMAINADMRPKMMAIRDASEADRPALMKSLSEARDARLNKALPPDLAKKVIESMNMQRGGGQRPPGGGGGK